MKIKIQDYDDVTVVQLQGQLDGEVAEMFQKTINDVITKSQAGIVLDMKEIEFIDSQGLGKLLWARDYCRANKRELRIAGLDENCRKILEITRLEDEFDYYDELADAVKSFT